MAEACPPPAGAKCPSTLMACPMNMQSDLSVNFGLLRLSYHLSPNPSGSIGFGATCGSVTSLNTAGYSSE